MTTSVHSQPRRDAVDFDASSRLRERSELLLALACATPLVVAAAWAWATAAPRSVPLGIALASGIGGWIAGTLALHRSLATRRARARHRLRTAERRLRERSFERDALLAELLDSIDDAVFGLDDEGHLRIANEAGLRIIGKPWVDVAGMHANELGMASLLRGPAPRVLELLAPGGPRRARLRRVRVHRDAQPLTMLVVHEGDLGNEGEQLTAWRRLVRVLGHEINNSLTPVALSAGSLRAYIEPDARPPGWEERLSQGLDVIEGRALALSRFVGAYANLARLPVPEYRRVDVQALVERTTALHGIARVDVSPGPTAEVLADSDQLEQALINLIRNALEAVAESNRGGVRVMWAVEEDDVVLRIVDDGPGLTEPDKVFVPFHSTKPEGSGIGLTLAREVTEAHGGSLDLRNREGASGCEATMRLPRFESNRAHPVATRRMVN